MTHAHDNYGECAGVGRPVAVNVLIAEVFCPDCGKKLPVNNLHALVPVHEQNTELLNTDAPPERHPAYSKLDNSHTLYSSALEPAWYEVEPDGE